MEFRRIPLIVLTVSVLCAMGSRGAEKAARPIAPEKFIPTYTIKYGSMSSGLRSTEETARFDLLIVSTAKAASRVWARDGRNSWQALKRLNPDMIIVTYKNSPTRYNTAPWGAIGEGWEWMKSHHGKGAADRWVAIGARTGAYMQSPVYPNERLMLPGNPNWQRYWLENVFADLWGGRRGFDMAGVDGLFADNTNYDLPTNWHAEGRPDQQDLPETYSADGKPLPDKWREDVNSFLRRAVPWLDQRGLALVPNFGSLGKNADGWKYLDSLPHPPFAAMDEAGFICPYGASSFNTWSWLQSVRTLRGLRHVRALVNNHGKVRSDVRGLERMDVLGEKSHSHKDRMTGWEALWFALTSFLLGFDDVRRNAFMNFTVWGYSEYHWFDEFDPKFLHLGRAVGEMQKVEGRKGAVYLREFEDGWAVVNPLYEDAVGVRVPVGSARVITHANLHHPDTAPLVTQFDLPKHRGVILLKSGRALGNSDNPR